jgi:hypothetical protein
MRQQEIAMAEIVKKAKAPTKSKKTATKKAEELKMADPSILHTRSRNLHSSSGLSGAGRMDTQSRIGFELSENSCAGLVSALSCSQGLRIVVAEKPSFEKLVPSEDWSFRVAR